MKHHHILLLMQVWIQSGKIHYTRLTPGFFQIICDCFHTAGWSFCIWVFFAETFRSFLLRHFGHWNISVTCLTVVLKLAITVFFSLYFQKFGPKWFNFFRPFQKCFSLWPKKIALHVPQCLELWAKFLGTHVWKTFLNLWTIRYT